MPTVNFIYALCDPRNGEARYVGKSSRGWNRVKEHTQPSKLKRRTLKNNWIKSLLSAGLRPDAFVLEEGSHPEQEAYWIACLRSLGCRLLNHTSGGEGTVGYRHSPKTKALLSKQAKGRAGTPHTEEHRRYMSQVLRGRPKTETSKIKSSRTRGGRPVLDSDGRRYETYAEAARHFQVSVSAVTRVLKGERRTLHGKELRYADS